MRASLGHAYRLLWERLEASQKWALFQLFCGHLAILVLDLFGLFILFVLVQYVVDIERYMLFVELNFAGLKSLLIAPTGPWFLALVMLVKSGLSFVVQKTLWKHTYALAAQLSDRTYFATFDHQFQDSLSTQLNKVKSVTDILPNLLLNPMLLLVSEVLILLFFAMIIVSMQPIVALIMTIFLAVPLTISLLLGQWKLREIGSQIDHNNQEQKEAITQAIKGQPEIRLFNRIQDFKAWFQEVRNKAYSGRVTAQVWSSVVPQRTFETLTIVGIVVLIFASQRFGGSWPLSHYVALYVAIAFRALPSLNRIVSSSNLIQTYEVILAYIPKVKSGPVTTSSIQLSKIWETLKISNIEFSYSGKNVDALRKLQVIIERGDFWLINGESGVGKTTLLNIISGLYGTPKPVIQIDGEDVHDGFTWGEALGYLRQNPFLFNGSILDNILFGHPHEPERLEKLLEDIDLATWISALPNGLDTLIGDGGNQVSGGQAQRIALARILYRQPSIILLDEPTNALDVESKSAIWSALKAYHARGTTILCVTHDESLETDYTKSLSING